MRRRTVILISGRGSNMMSLVEAAAAGDYPAVVAAVISNRPDAAGLQWAAQRAIPTRVIDHRSFAGREPFEAALHAALTEFQAEIVCLAGFMRVLTAGFVERWSGRMINIHPSLLPSFKGLHTHERVLEAGVRIAGCTVHFVVPEMDAGPIIAQAAVPVAAADVAGTLAARVLAAEHKLYPHALAMVAAGQARMEGSRVSVDGEAGPPPGVLFAPSLPRD